MFVIIGDFTDMLLLLLLLPWLLPGTFSLKIVSASLRVEIERDRVCGRRQSLDNDSTRLINRANVGTIIKLCTQFLVFYGIGVTQAVRANEYLWHLKHKLFCILHISRQGKFIVNLIDFMWEETSERSSPNRYIYIVYVYKKVCWVHTSCHTMPPLYRQFVGPPLTLIDDVAGRRKSVISNTLKMRNH